MIKVTNEKTYLANRISYQRIGITPHIQLPSLIEINTYGETFLPNSIKPDTIDPFNDYFYDFEIPKKILLSKSFERVNSNNQLRAIKKINENFDALVNNEDQIVLNLDSMLNRINRCNKLSEEWKTLLNHVSEKYKASENFFDCEISIKDEFRKTINERFIESLNKDFYVEECYQVLCDWIELLTHD